MAADWQGPQDVSLNELALLHRARVLYTHGKSPFAIAGMLPFTMFSAQLRRDFPNRVSFTAEAQATYSVWSLGHSIERVSYEEFSRPSKKVRSKPAASRIGRKSVDQAAVVAEATRDNTHDAVLRAYQSLQRGRPKSIDWRVVTAPSYPGRELVDLASIAPLWVRTFRAHIHHRVHVKGYRSTDDVVACLNLLADYLFFYLPWWKQMYPRGKVAVPKRPRDFSRFAFVARDADISIDELPAPLLQHIALRRPNKTSASVAVHKLTQYFEFVRTQFAEDEEVAGHGFTSPINDEFDAPRIRRRAKTAKAIIPKNIYGHLLFYCYAIEEFGLHLQQLAVQRRLPSARGVLRTAQRFTCCEFGHVPFVKYRGKKIPVESVPNLFTWVERQIDVGPDGNPAIVYMPHLTALRLLIASLETGLRCQSIQWLDRLSWDSPNTNAPPESYTYALLVNTDKTREHAWTTYVVHRVRALLQRERTFQESFSDANEFAPVDYEGVEQSPFDSIRPLFRAPTSGRPVSDTEYAETWAMLMVDFEAFYRAASGEQHVRMIRMKARMNPDGTPVIQFRDKGHGPYCAISVLAVHTPHSCRATFATNRQGVLELSDVADLLGHQSDVVTAYYTKPSAQALHARLRDSDTAIVSDYTMFDASSDAHIRADRPESALVRSFSRDRKGTLHRFRFMPPIALWSTENTLDEGEGLKLLREGPMSRIRFRETHICPVGEECPGDIIEQIGAPRRCGACPLAMKCVDHLPAIAAKKNQLLERIKYLHRRRELMEEACEPTAALDEVWEDLELDINELLGWQLSEEVLSALRKQDASDEGAENVLHVDRPEIVRRHLERVTRSCNSTELLLQRIADCNAYPTFSTQQVQAAAGKLKRKLLAGRNVDAIETWTNDLEDVKSAAKMLSLMMKAGGVSMSEVAVLLSEPESMALEPVLLSGGAHA